MSIPVFQQWINFQIGFGFEYYRFWSFVKLQCFRFSSPISVAIRIKSIQYWSKRIRPKYQNWLEYFHARIFSIFGSNFFFFPFYVSTYIWPVKFFKSHFSTDVHPWILLASCLHSLLVLISYKEKIHIMSIFMRKLVNSHIYV